MISVKFYIKGRPYFDEPYHLKGVGLPNIFLLNGVTLENDPDYGELVSIENVAGLYRAIGLHIIESEPPMTGAELRFLRKQMEFTQAELGSLLSVSSQTVANYEKDKTSIGTADLAVRLLYLLHVLPPESRTSVIKQLVGAASRVAKAPLRRLPEMPRRKLVGKWLEPACLAA